jgi:hypothetical protein
MKTKLVVTKELLTNLKKLANKATKGRWYCFDSGPWGGEGVGVQIGKEVKEWFQTAGKTHEVNINNGFYIAAANPKVVLSLLDYIKDLEEQLIAATIYPSIED